jgi:hypothetical protein
VELGVLTVMGAVFARRVAAARRQGKYWTTRRAALAVDAGVVLGLTVRRRIRGRRSLCCR